MHSPQLDLPMSDFVHDLLVARRSIGDGKWVFPANSIISVHAFSRFYRNDDGDRLAIVAESFTDALKTSRLSFLVVPMSGYSGFLEALRSDTLIC
jgi:hypothetical protein